MRLTETVIIILPTPLITENYTKLTVSINVLMEASRECGMAADEDGG
jgi:hypothetical protein